ncbi:hypothetical protein PENTCL1PPCAC_16849, partial [Pristionchus entomophagus]
LQLEMEAKRLFIQHSDRVKSLDLHPTEPWLLVSLLNGEVAIWNHQTKENVRTFKVCDAPVRAAVFVPREGWVVTGSDDKLVRVYNYITGEFLHQFQAHEDFVRCIAVHPTQSFILTCGDDKLIKQWNWDNEWALQQTFGGHDHYVMQIASIPMIPTHSHRLHSTKT